MRVRKMKISCFICWGFLSLAHSWPGMRRPATSDETDYIGPSCTVGAHNWHPESGPCPNMEQPPPPTPFSNNTHVWPNSYTIEWEFYFVPDDNDAPPYNPYPTSPYNKTLGKTFYFNDEVTGERNMKEEYYEFCIPVFGAPFSSMGRWNKYSCDFLNVGSTKTSYVVLHDDRPPGAPECCIIGQPFHPSPPDFTTLMPTASTSPVGDSIIDWFTVYDADAGIFSYGFDSNAVGTPYAFYMKGVPWVANWMWQKFFNFRQEVPEPLVWVLPEICTQATACPGW